MIFYYSQGAIVCDSRIRIYDSESNLVADIGKPNGKVQL